MRERVLSSDYRIAVNALDTNVKAMDIEAVCLSLKHRALSLKIKAADALGSLRNRQAVKCLNDALKENLTYRPYDTESTILRNELSRSLIDALRQITGLNLSTKKKYSDSEIEQIIERTEKWQ